MKLLVLNVGSSSVRLALTDVGAHGVHLLDVYRGREESASAARISAFLGRQGVRALDGVAHRVVHGGAKLTQACLIDVSVEAEIARLAPLAPLHNPAALAWIAACREVLGEQVPQVAVFDTAFYSDLPAASRLYAIPRELADRHGLRRFGFHGLAHRAMWNRWRRLRPDVPSGDRVISFQLGGGCSITAIRDGRPIDTSMGFSPLEGLVMATRSGDIDPGLLLYLQRSAGMSFGQIEAMLSQSSGLLGLSGASADMHALLESDDEASRLAVEVYCWRARKYLGAYLAALGGADAVLFGGGVGENAPAVRERILAGMKWAGIALDPEANRDATGTERSIGGQTGKVALWVIPVDEATVIAEDAAQVIAKRRG